MENGRVDGGAAGFVDAGRAAGDNQATRALQRMCGSFAGGNFSVDTQIADPASDQVAILPSGIEDRDLGTQSLF